MTVAMKVSGSPSTKFLLMNLSSPKKFLAMNLPSSQKFQSMNLPSSKKFLSMNLPSKDRDQFLKSDDTFLYLGYVTF